MVDFCNKKIAANYFKGVESVGGHLYFDENHMVFKSHFINVQRGETKIEYKDILGIEKRNSFFVVPNGISIFTVDGLEHKFVINRRSKVIDFLFSKVSR